MRTYLNTLKNRWVMQFTKIPILSGATGDNPVDLAFCAHTARRPSISYNVTEFQRLNERFYVAGKPTWGEMAMTFFDFIKGSSSVSNLLWNWNQVVYSPITGQMGFKKDYTTSGTLAMLDPKGAVIQIWNLFYCWPYNIDWGDLSADDDGLSEVSVTFRYDYAVKGTDVDTTP